MTFDPFADAPTDEAQTETTSNASPWEDAPVPSTPTTTPADGNKVRVTLKGGSGYDAPWITLDGASVTDALNQMTEFAEDLKALVDRAAQVGRYFASTGNKATDGHAQKGGNSGGQSGKPEGATEAPNGEKRFCSHGEMDWTSKISKKTSKPYSGWFCTSRECDPQWPNKK